MELSVVVPTLNGRERLGGCLDALAARAPSADVVVVNGPSADGTTGMVREREDVDVLVEVSERNVTVAINAGIATAVGDVVAVVGDDHAIEPPWYDAVGGAIGEGADVVTGPTHRSVRAGVTTQSLETADICGRRVAFFNPRNVAFDRDALAAIDGFDEHLHHGVARDAAHRLAGLDRDVGWRSGMSVRSEASPRDGPDRGPTGRVSAPDGGRVPPADGGPDRRAVDRDVDFREKYRSLAYRLSKNYSLRPGVLRRLAGDAGADAVASGRAVLDGDLATTAWLGNGRAVLGGVASGVASGLRARLADRSPARNPNGLSARADRAVRRYDWR